MEGEKEGVSGVPGLVGVHVVLELEGVFEVDVPADGLVGVCEMPVC